MASFHQNFQNSHPVGQFPRLQLLFAGIVWRDQAKDLPKFLIRKIRRSFWDHDVDDHHLSRRLLQFLPTQLSYTILMLM